MTRARQTNLLAQSGASHGLIGLSIPQDGNVFLTLDPADWHGIDPPEREWMLENWLPRRRASYLTGAGGTGKSLLGQELATCVALGRPLFGIATAEAPAIYLTAEDDAAELQRRQRAICVALGVDEVQLSRRLIPISLFGLADNRMVTFDRDEGLLLLPAWAKLRNTALATRAKLIVLDNVSHIFDGSEIDRAQVTAFANLLNGLAQEIDGAVLLIGHPNKQGDAYSGSTAWENAFRSRIYLDASSKEQSHTDPDLRQLTLPKANYARKGASVDIRWHEGALVLDADLPEGMGASLDAIKRANASNDAFLKCLATATSNRRAVSHVPGVNYAPKVFAAMIEGKRFGEEAFADAMERLVHTGAIEFDQPLWQGKNRHWKQGIRLAEGCANPSAKSLKNLAPTPAPTTCASH